MQKMAIIFVNGAQEDTAVLIQQCTRACVGAYAKQLGIFGKKTTDFEVVVVHVLDLQTIQALRYNVDKYGMNHFFVTDSESNPDPRRTVLAVGPADAEKLNKMSAGLRLF
jgi:peptidyl-tRNA hydrolase